MFTPPLRDSPPGMKCRNQIHWEPESTKAQGMLRLCQDSGGKGWEEDEHPGIADKDPAQWEFEFRPGI